MKLIKAAFFFLPLMRCFGGVTVEDLKCEYRTNPLGIDTPQPRLSWTLQSDRRGEMQGACQILAATTPEKLAKNKADLWDSGKVSSNESVHIVYAGPTLRSGQRVYWKVRTWGSDKKPSEYSEAAWWEMSLLSMNDWKATWIARHSKGARTEEEMFNDHPVPLFRKEFSVGKKISRARLYVSGLGYYEVHLNGKRVGDHILDPGWTSYSKRVFYSTYDVTSQLRSGGNALGVMLGNGWFNPLPLRMWGRINPRDSLRIGEPQMILQLVVEFSDGSSQIVASDESWKVSNGPILRNSVYLGEVYDARKEQAGWDQPNFDDSGWEKVIPAKSTLGKLVAQEAPPMRITRTLKPVKVTEPKPGVYIVDFGQNFAGWTQLHVKGPAGTKVRMRYGELLYPDGTLNGMTSVCGQIKGGGKDYIYDGNGRPKTAFQIDEYVLKGSGETEVFTPHFTFHGFRYVEVTTFSGSTKLQVRSSAFRRPEPPEGGTPSEQKVIVESIEGLRLNSDVQPAGSFSCSNEMFNRIQEMVLWTQLANMFSVQSDCPHREKFGYGGDIVGASEMALLNFDMENFYAKVAHDFTDAVRPNGGFTETAPFVGIADESLGEGAGPVGWGTAHPLLVWQLYQYYGDRRLLEEQFDNVKRWVELLNGKAKDFILDNGISDHESLVPKPRAVTGTAFYFLNAKLLAKMGRVLGKNSEATEAELLSEKIKAAFNQKFLQSETGKYHSGTQCCQAVALYFGLAPEEQKSKVLDLLVRDVQETHKGHLSTGIFGTKYMLHSLADTGRADVAYEIVNQKTFPGWGHMLERGATTLWEHWEFSDNTYSHNHPMFGSVSEWFYKVVAGISPAEDAVGFDKIIIWPRWIWDLKWAKASYKSVRGEILSEWERDPGDDTPFKLHVRIPPNAIANIYIRAMSPDRVTESGKALHHVKGVKLLRMEKGNAVLLVGSGDYHFVSEFSP